MLFKTLNLNNNNLYNIADIKTKNTYIEEWKERGLLKGYFGTLAKNIYNRTRVKNSEILELLIYGAYIEEQSKLDEYEKQIMYDDVNYYYQQGQQEVIKAQNKKKPISIIDMALFLYLLEQPNYSGLNWKQYIDTMIQYNVQQLYKQVLLNIQQQKELEIEDNEFQRIINQQNNQRLSVNNDKISGFMDMQMIGLNNLAKAEGIKEQDNNAKVIFLGNIDGKETPMCHSLHRQEFYIDKWNEFDRYYGETAKDLTIQRIRCKGLVLGLNLPPISHHFHWCRSMIQYVPSIKIEENNKENGLKKRKISTLNKSLSKYNTKNISKMALKQNINNANKVVKDFPILNNKIKDIKIRSNKDYSMAIKPQEDGNGFNIYINKDSFKSIKTARQEHEELVELKEAPKGTTYKDILTHELGHVTTYEIIKKKYNGNLNLIDKDWCNSITSTEIVNKALKNIGIVEYRERYKTISNLSKYSLENASETIGEAFADYYSNGVKSQKISKEIIKVMKGMI